MANSCQLVKFVSLFLRSNVASTFPTLNVGRNLHNQLEINPHINNNHESTKNATNINTNINPTAAQATPLRESTSPAAKPSAFPIFLPFGHGLC
jgi:hypothetical protein